MSATELARQLIFRTESKVVELRKIGLLMQVSRRATTAPAIVWNERLR